MNLTTNWTKLEALARTLLILGASAFTGAIVLPVMTNGELPTTWAAWRPIIAVAVAASVTAEFIWIRTHLQQAAQAIGLIANDPSLSTESKTVVKAHLARLGIAVTSLAIAVICSVGCTPAASAQAVTDTQQAIDLTDAVCSLAPDSPVGQPYVDLICSLAEAGEQLVSVVVGAIGSLEADSGPAKLTSGFALMRVPVRQIRFSYPAPKASKFLAEHQVKAKR